MYSLPTTVTVKDRQFHITNNGDFRMVLDCFGALNDTEMGEDYRVLASLIIFYEEFTDIEQRVEYADYYEGLILEMFKFFNGGKLEAPGHTTKTNYIDWVKDEQIICAAVNNVAKKEIRELDYLHWWTFMGYFLSVGESVLGTVVGIRNKIVKGKKLEKWEREFKFNNPDYFVWNKNEDNDLDALLNQLRDGGDTNAKE